MRSLKYWLATSTPSHQRLIDTAMVVALLPHLFAAKVPMLLYMVLVLAVLIRVKVASRGMMAFFVITGAAAIAVSFLGAFNFVGLSELSTFIQMVSSLLIYAVSLQRLSRKINFYLLISPMLLLALSYFFYNSIFMLGYAIAALYVFLLLLLWARMHAPLVEALRSASMLFMMALPIVTLLFMVFPRISFEKRGFGFKETASLRTGHDGLMHTGEAALLVPSKRVAMEVWFDEGLPKTGELYFRGSVLYEDRGKVWVPRKFGRDLRVLGKSSVPNSISYRITLYPHKKRWLYLLDYPVSMERKANYSRDLIVTWDRPIDEVFRYSAASLLAGGNATEVEPAIMPLALQVHSGRDPKSESAMAQIAQDHSAKKARLEALNRWFASRKLNYTLKPGVVDPEHPVDAFVFGTKKGYCVHFASAYATMARMLGIPSRVVTGFKGDAGKSVENYLVVREEDAHAWVEVYLQGRGWQRVDPTQFSAGVASGDVQTAQAVEKQERMLWRQVADKVNLYVMYTKFVIQKWVLYYDRSTQMQLLRELMQDTLLVLKFAGVFLLLIVAGTVSYITLRREQCRDAVLCAMRPLLKTLAHNGMAKHSGEDMHAFLQRAAESLQTDISSIDRLYHTLRYGAATPAEKVKELEILCRRFKLEN